MKYSSDQHNYSKSPVASNVTAAGKTGVGTLDPMHLDVLTMGRCGIDMFPLQSGLPLDQVRTFQKSLGGSAANVAVGSAQLGLQSGLVSLVGDDPFGRFVTSELERLNVDTTYVATHPDLPTPITFCELFAPDNFPLYFYRQPDAPDFSISLEELDEEAVANAKIFWVTLTGFASQPTRQAHHQALDWRMDRKPGHLSILDLDFRHQLWPSTDIAADVIADIVPKVDVIVGNETEWQVATRGQSVEETAEHFFELGVSQLVVKRGPNGSTVITPTKTTTHQTLEVDVVNGLGAGDAFGAAFCYGCLEQTSTDKSIEFANAAGAYVASHLECAIAMPTVQELTTFIARHSGVASTSPNPRLSNQDG